MLKSRWQSAVALGEMFLPLGAVGQLYRPRALVRVVMNFGSVIGACAQAIEGQETSPAWGPEGPVSRVCEMATWWLCGMNGPAILTF